MRCPNCGAKIQKSANVCLKCGTYVSQINNSSHKDVKVAKAEFQPENIVLSTVFPKDLSKKVTLLLCIFLGAFGGHYFYVKRYVPAVVFLVVSVLFLAFFTTASFLQGIIINGGIVSFADKSLEIFAVFLSVAQALVITLWLTDIVKILCKRFKVPVVLGKK